MNNVVMSKSLTAVLLSAFVYPGSGHFYLKKHIQGLLFASVATVSLYFLLVTVVKMAQDISDKILNGEIPIDVIEITEVILKLLEDSGIHQVNIATSVFFICWLVSIVDSYRLGRIEESNDKAT